MTSALLGLQPKHKAAASPWVCRQLGLEHRHREVQGKGMMTTGEHSSSWSTSTVVLAGVRL